MAKDTTTTFEVAGAGGRHLADGMSARIVDTIDGFPTGSSTGSPNEQRAAIARMIADSLYTYADEVER
jgi:hypothetical protein